LLGSSKPNLHHQALRQCTIGVSPLSRMKHTDAHLVWRTTAAWQLRVLRGRDLFAVRDTLISKPPCNVRNMFLLLQISEHALYTVRSAFTCQQNTIGRYVADGCDLQAEHAGGQLKGTPFKFRPRRVPDRRLRWDASYSLKMSHSFSSNCPMSCTTSTLSPSVHGLQDAAEERFGSERLRCLASTGARGPV